MQSPMIYARKHCDQKTLERIISSYNKIFKYTLITLLVLILAYGIAVSLAYAKFDNHSADSTRIGRVNGEIIWYVQDIKREIKLSDYGYNSLDFNDNDKFTVFLDKENNVIDIEPERSEFSGPPVVMVGGLILMIIIMFTYIPICYNTFGKDYRTFVRWYNETKPENEKFTF